MTEDMSVLEKEGRIWWRRCWIIGSYFKLTDGAGKRIVIALDFDEVRREFLANERPDCLL